MAAYAAPEYVPLYREVRYDNAGLEKKFLLRNSPEMHCVIPKRLPHTIPVLYCLICRKIGHDAFW